MVAGVDVVSGEGVVPGGDVVSGVDVVSGEGVVPGGDVVSGEDVVSGGGEVADVVAGVCVVADVVAGVCVVAGGDGAAVDGSAIKKMWPLWLTTYMTTTIYQLTQEDNSA